PLAVAVIGGLTVATFLTLIVVPVVYTILEDLAEKVKKRVSGLVWPR
ncbi:MAG: Odulation protein NolG, partial [Thermoanaerobacterales bacterium 50_218]